MPVDYIEHREGVFRLVGSRISLDSVVHLFLNGETAESIAQSFPTLTLEQVYGAITYYLAHQAEIDDYLAQGEARFEELREEARAADPMFYKKLADARRRQISVL